MMLLTSTPTTMGDTREGDILIRVVGDDFVAGVVARNGRIIEAAPILRRHVGLQSRMFAQFCLRNGWSWQRWLRTPTAKWSRLTGSKKPVARGAPGGRSYTDCENRKAIGS